MNKLPLFFLKRCPLIFAKSVTSPIGGRGGYLRFEALPYTWASPFPVAIGCLWWFIRPCTFGQNVTNVLPKQEKRVGK